MTIKLPKMCFEFLAMAFSFELCILIYLSVPCFAAGNESYAFLKIPQGAKAVALGSAFSAVADDPSAIYWNPSGITQIQSREIYSSFTYWLLGSSVANFGYVQNLHPHSLGISFFNLNYGAINETSSTEPAGTGKAFSPYESLLTMSYALNLSDNLCGGLNLNFISQNLGVSSSSWQSADLGLLFKAQKVKGLSVGATCKNLAFNLKLPRSLRLGAAYTIEIEEPDHEKDTATFIADYVSYADRSALTYGVDYIYKNLVAFRAGHNGGNLTFGIGIKYSNFGIDLAFVPYDDLGNTYRVALDYKL